jgi:hypothetical protein
MSTIVTRAGKGSALTWTEGDANITNLNNDKIEDIVEDLTPQLGGDLDVNGNTIKALVNANINLTVTGTGAINLSHGDPDTGGALVIGNGTNHAVIRGNGATNVFFAANGGATSLGLLSTGEVALSTNKTILGTGSAATNLTTSGAYNLTINTNNGTNAGTITLAQGANGNITFAPNGTGATVAQGPFVATTTPTGPGSTPLLGRSVVTLANSVRYYSGNLQKGRSDITLASMTNEPVTLGFSVRDSSLTARIFASQRAVYQGTGTNPYFTFDVSVDGFTTTVPVVTMGGGIATWGSSGTYTHTTSGTTDLIFSTNSGTNSGTITINDGANGNIVLTPNGTGQTVVKNLEYNEYVNAVGNSSGTITPDCASGNVQTITAVGNITFNAFTNPVSGQTLTLIITQDATGGRTLTSTMLFAGGSKTLSTAANAVDILTVSYIGTTYYASLAKGFA